MMKNKKINLIFITFTLLILLCCLSSTYAGNDTVSDDKKIVSNIESADNYEESNQNTLVKTKKKSKGNHNDLNITVNPIDSSDYLSTTNISGRITTENEISSIKLYIDNKKCSNKSFNLNNNGFFTYKTTQDIGNHTFKILVNDSVNVKKATANFTVTDKIFPLLDKSRPIYFAMDHTNSKDKKICKNIVGILKNNGFKVKRYAIGPNAMYSNMLYLYKNKITNAVMFHLFNGVDPSNIREVATNGNDNRGRIVRKRGNDVVLAWFYDSSDAVNEYGSCYYSVRGSETGGRLYHPKRYMDKNDIRYICTSSDHHRHTDNADYTGEKSAVEFMRFFEGYSAYKFSTKMTLTYTLDSNDNLNISGVVKKSNYKINGYVYITDSSGKILKNNIKVTENKFSTEISFKKSGRYNLTVIYKGNDYYKNSSRKINNVVIPRNVSISVVQPKKYYANNYITISVNDSKTKKPLSNETIEITYPDNTSQIYKSDSEGKLLLSLNYTHNRTLKILIRDEYNSIINSTIFNVIVNKDVVRIDVGELRGTIGENITLRAFISDYNYRPVTGGNIVFKLNGITLKTDGRFDSNEDALKFNVKNGYVEYTIFADMYLRKAKNITVSYSGTARYAQTTSKVFSAGISKRYAKINLTLSPGIQKQYRKILFTAKVDDVSYNAVNEKLIHENASVIFKVNGKTLTDRKNNVIKVPVGEDNIARYYYTVPAGMGGISNDKNMRNYGVTAIYESENYYPTARNNSHFNVERSPISIFFNKTIVYENALSVNASIVDYMRKHVIGTNKIAIKVNGVTLKDSEGNVIYVNVENGNICLENLQLDDSVKVRSVMLVTGERQAYLSCRNETSDIIVDL